MPTAIVLLKVETTGIKQKKQASLILHALKWNHSHLEVKTLFSAEPRPTCSQQLSKAIVHLNLLNYSPPIIYLWSPLFSALPAYVLYFDGGCEQGSKVRKVGRFCSLVNQ